MLSKLLIKNLYAIEESLRGTGRTTRLVQKALETDSVFVCHCHSQMLDLRRQYPKLRMVTIEQYLDPNFNRGSSEHFWFGSRKCSVIFDHFVEFQLLKKELDAIENLVEQNHSTSISSKTHGLKADLGVGDYRG